MLYSLPNLVRVFAAFILLTIFSSCSTYYQKSKAMMDAVYAGKYAEADKIIDKSASLKRKRDILLYYLNRGTLNWMNGNNAESNKYFQQADYYIEDVQNNYGYIALGLVTNPSLEPYQGEGFEKILLHYYATLNYLKLGNYDDALVECKRMQLKMQKITDAYNGKNKYKNDAFAHLLLGIIYDAQKDYNNAFIAYRNAYEIYDKEYASMFALNIPEQLKIDIIRTAYQSGFQDEGHNYEDHFGITYTPSQDSSGSFVFFWNNGLGPVKDEWSLNFFITPAGGNMMYFENTELNIRFQFQVNDDDQKNDLSKLKVIRVAFPKYITRTPAFKSGKLIQDSLQLNANLCLVEPINAIAYRSLQDRMLKELGEALLRLAIKQVAEAQVRKKNEGMGAAVGLLNAFTEQADTRNWQLLPFSINYTRMDLPVGKQKLKVVLSGDANSITKDLESEIKFHETSFGYFQDFQFIGYSEKP